MTKPVGLDIRIVVQPNNSPTLTLVSYLMTLCPCEPARFFRDPRFLASPCPDCFFLSRLACGRLQVPHLLSTVDAAH